MPDKSNLPVVVEDRNKLDKLKNIIVKTGKFMGYSLATGGLIIGGVLFPPALIPSIAGAYFTGQKILNNSIYKEYKDLVFITKKNKNNITIAQDSTKIGILKELRGLTNMEKVGFMQLQAIIGMSKFSRQDNKGEILNFSTLTHGVNIKTFEKLQELGYIENLEKNFYKNIRMPIESLAFGNVKGLFQKKDFYEISFNRTDKSINIENEELQKAFRLVFNSKKGIIAKKGYKFEYNKNGQLEINYKVEEVSKDNEYSIKAKRDDFKKKMQENAPSLEQQKETAYNNSLEIQSKNINNNNREERE